MARRALAACALFGLTGCSLSPSADVIRELAKDPATVSVNVQTPYGSLKWLRSNATTCTPVQLDGNSLTIGK